MAALAYTLIFDDNVRIDMRYVCPKDVKKMLMQQARSVCRKKWAAKHEYEESKEGIWLETALAVLRKKTKENWTEKRRNVARKLVLEKDGRRRNSSTLVGRMKVNVKLVTRKKAQKSAGSTICPEWYEVRREIPDASESGRKKRELQRRSGSCKGVW